MNKIILFAILLVVYAMPVFGATPDTVTVGPIGATECGGSGCDYNSLFAAEAAEERDISLATGSDEVVTFEVWNMDDTTNLSFAGTWSTESPDNYIIVYGADAERTSINMGRLSTERYRLTVNTNFTVGQPHMIFDGFQVANNLGGNSSTMYITGWGIVTDSFIKIIDSVIIRDYSEAAGGSGQGIRIYESATNLIELINTVVYLDDVGVTPQANASALTIGQWGASSYLYLYNSVFIGGYYGADLWGAVANETIKNCIFADQSFEAFIDEDTTEKNICEPDAASSCDGASGTNKDADVTFAGALDWHLGSNETDPIGYGEDLSGIFTKDVDGNPRNVPWDTGIDQTVISGGSGVIPISKTFPISLIPIIGTSGMITP